jgi:hypothetical protein
MKARSWIAVASLGCAAVLSMAADEAREVAGVAMPETINVPGGGLRLNGVGVRREKALFKAYVIALYLPKRATDGATVIAANETKRLAITMLRDVGREAFVDAIESGILRNSKTAMPALRARLDMLEQAVPDLKKGDELDMTWVPGSGTVVRGQGRTMTIPGKDFADALFGVWLGLRPVEGTLKRALLGG